MGLHGPCGPMFPRKSCMRDGKCYYGYRKNYQTETELNDNAYPVYRRRSPNEGGNTFKKFIRNVEHEFTNGDVVPYNKYLLFKYKCHINVECINSDMDNIKKFYSQNYFDIICFCYICEY